MNYYNEHDPKAAAWLRELIREGHIPDGEIDTRSIRDVRATDLVQFTQCHFFAGIGGWSLALRLAGWPDDEPVWTGSCPCQPFSSAGKQMGNEDSRHLWPAFRRLILHGAPPVVIGEQVASALGRQWLAGIRANLETMGYAVGSADLCAAGVGAPQIRQRLFWVADDIKHGWEARSRDKRETQGTRLQHGHDLERRGSNGRMADTADGGRAEHERESGQRRITGPLDAAECPSTGNGMEHPALDEREQRRAQSVGRSIVSGCGNSGLVDATLPQGERFGQLGEQLHRQTAWSAFDLIPCADGKARRIEPGTFPLAHGVSGRVGLLRGYGNAVVPQVAAQFIQAYLKARDLINLQHLTCTV